MNSREISARLNDVDDSVRMDFHKIHSENAIKNDVFGEIYFKGLVFGSKLLACATCSAQLIKEVTGFGGELIGLSSGDEVEKCFREGMVKVIVEFLQFSFREENGIVLPCDEEVSFLPDDWDSPIV